MNLTFVHIPRTGGVSIGSMPYVNNLGHVQASKAVEPGVFSFAFVRNPYDRLLSTFYFYFSRYDKKHRTELQRQIREQGNFENFVQNIHEFKDTQLLPQSYFLDAHVDFIGEFKNLQKDWEMICIANGIDVNLLPQRNGTSHDDWKTYYTKEMKRIVYNKFSEDFLRFGYAK